MLTRAQAVLGSNWSLHDLRRAALKRMARDPQPNMSDVQWVAGHAHIPTTEIYPEPRPDDVVAEVLAHHARRGRQPALAPPAPACRPEVLAAVFGTAMAAGCSRVEERPTMIPHAEISAAMVRERINTLLTEAHG